MGKIVKAVTKERIILGMDPGTTIMGYGVILIKNKEIKLLQYGVIKLSKYPNHAIKLSNEYNN